jgi:hypothetical protein
LFHYSTAFQFKFTTENLKKVKKIFKKRGGTGCHRQQAHVEQDVELSMKASAAATKEELFKYCRL